MLVVAGREAAPLLEVAEAALNDVTAPVVLTVTAHGPAASWSASLAMALLVSRFGDHGGDPAFSQMSAGRAAK